MEQSPRNFSRPQEIENYRNCLLLGTDSLQKTVVKSCSAPEEEEREIMHEEKAEQT